MSNWLDFKLPDASDVCEFMHKRLGVECNCHVVMPCLTSYTIATPDREYEYQSGAPTLRPISVVDTPKEKGEGTQGVDISITMMGACTEGAPECPRGILMEQGMSSESQTINDQQCAQATLYYRPEPNEKWRLFHHLFNQFFRPLEQSSYTVYDFYVVQQYHGSIQDDPWEETVNNLKFKYALNQLPSQTSVQILVYPENKLKADIRIQCQKPDDNAKEQTKPNDEAAALPAPEASQESEASASSESVPLLEYHPITPEFKQGYEPAQIKRGLMDWFSASGELSYTDGAGVVLTWKKPGDGKSEMGAAVDGHQYSMTTNGGDLEASAEFDDQTFSLESTDATLKVSAELGDQTFSLESTDETLKISTEWSDSQDDKDSQDESRQSKASTFDLSAEFESSKHQIPLLQALSGVADLVTGGIYQPKQVQRKKDDIKVIGCNFSLPDIHFTGENKTVIVDGVVGSECMMTIKGSPFIGVEVTLDLIQAAASYFKAERVIAKIREKARELEEKAKAGQGSLYLGADLAIKVGATIGGEIQIQNVNNQPCEYFLSQADFAVSIEGTANVRGGIEVWIVHGTFELAGNINAEANLRLQQKAGRDGIELVLYHQGIKCEVMVQLSGGIKNDDEKASERGRLNSIDGDEKIETEYSAPQEWIWVEPLSVEDSPYRTMLFD